MMFVNWLRDLVEVDRAIDQAPDRPFLASVNRPTQLLYLLPRLQDEAAAGRARRRWEHVGDAFGPAMPPRELLPGVVEYDLLEPEGPAPMRPAAAQLSLWA